MRRILLKSLPHCVRHFNSSNTLKPVSTKLLVLPLTSTQSNFKFFSSDNNNHSYSNPNEKALISSTQRLQEDSSIVEDVSNEDFNAMLKKFYQEESENEETMTTIMEAVFRRRLSGKHQETDDELLEYLKGENSSENDEDEESDEEGSDENSDSDEEGTDENSGSDEEGSDLQSENSDSEDASGDGETESD